MIPPVKGLASSCLGFSQDNRRVNGRSGLETQAEVTTIPPVFPEFHTFQKHFHEIYHLMGKSHLTEQEWIWWLVMGGVRN